MAYVKTRRAGGSLIVTLPREVAELLGLRESELVRITVERPNRSYFGAFRGVRKFTHKERADHRD
ncbi:MAG: AbrB/MazE/SpoVT family DNA-binding domain-containing protein [Thermoplasmata archaeon]